MAENPKRRRATTEPTHFLNVDLELEGRATAIATLTLALDRRLLPLYAGTVRGRTRAHYELRRQASTVDATLRGLLAVLERLTPAERRAWRAARVRDLDVGLQAGRVPDASEYAIAAKTLERLAALGGRLVLTVYAPFPRPGKRLSARGPH